MENIEVRGKPNKSTRILKFALPFTLSICWILFMITLGKMINIRTDIFELITIGGGTIILYSFPVMRRRSYNPFPIQLRFTRSGFQSTRIFIKGFISWEDVMEIEMRVPQEERITFSSSDMINIVVKNRAKYLSPRREKELDEGREEDFFKLYLSVNELDYDENEIYDWFIKYWEYDKKNGIL